MPSKLRRVFFAYPSAPQELVVTISSAVEQVQNQEAKIDLAAWPQLDVFGASIPDKIREAIAEADVIAADITVANQNVYYEIAFAMGLGKPVAPVVNASFAGAAANIQKDGLFDNIGYKSYENSHELAECFTQLSENPLVELYEKPINHSQPLFLLDAFRKTDFRNVIVSAIKASKVFYRSFDPAENPRLSTVSVISDITSAAGVIVPVLQKHIDDSGRHNLRAAFIAGIAHGLGRETFIVRHQSADDVQPADFRNNVVQFKNEDVLAEKVSEFATNALKVGQSIAVSKSKHVRSNLQKLTLGATAAENEFRTLQNYFVETSEYLRATRGEVRIIAGRKGSGKTAIFFQVRDHFRRVRDALVIDLKPESHQLSLFRASLLEIVDVGAYDHTIAAFWYFLILSEIALELRSHFEFRSHNDYNALSELAQIDRVLADYQIAYKGDFTSRITRLGTHIIREIEATKKRGESLSADRLTNIVFREGIAKLRKLIEGYAGEFTRLVFLFDNIDKSWPSAGVDPFDVRGVRLLVEALDKTRHEFAGDNSFFMSIIFLRNDIYELLVDETPDRGKAGELRIDWTDRSKLRQVIHLRLKDASNANDDKIFTDLWKQYFVEEVNGRDSFEYFVDHCLMRPRFLIQIVENAIANGINRQHARVESEDCIDAVKQHSNYLVSDFGYEIRDVSGLTEDILYAFIGASKTLTKAEIFEHLKSIDLPEESLDKAYNLLIWYGVFGLMHPGEKETYIYDFEYNQKRLMAELKQMGSNAAFALNPAFHVGLTR